jgi:alkyl sulfatase BDS1-like metallo-beta-lactamase superfamily hydrolase
LKANAELTKTLPFANRQDFDDAMRGFIGTMPDALVTGTGPRPVWSMKPYDFLKQNEVADSVNPSLWRQAQLNAIHGLFKVTERVYQVRGFDISNMTIIEGDTSLIIIDVLLTTETARAALELYYQHRPKKPVGTVIYSHSHGDHFGGVKGVISEADVAAGRVQVLAPAGFLEAVAGESVMAGTAMSRRAQYQFGPLLPAGPRGHVDTGLGKKVAAGTVTLIAPTGTIDKTMDKRVIDGVEIVFQLAPGSEAPSEMLMYFPQFRVLDMAEDDPQHAQPLHYSWLRGARWQSVVALHQRSDGELRRQERRHHRAASLARCRTGARRRPHEEAARPVQVHQRPVAAAVEPWLYARRDRRDPAHAREPGTGMVRPRLLRHAASQRQGGVSEIPWLVRRRSR